MRSEQEMYDLIINTARNDDGIRAVILNGSRANPNVPRDIFQDYDVIYLVTNVSAFKANPSWIKRFGELMILQLPDDMGEPSSSNVDSYAYLMQFADGNRIDLTLYPVSKLAELEKDSLSVLLLDKDGIVGPLAPASDTDYLPKPPTPKAFADCCNEFWWVSTYVAKGLWREEIIYAKAMFEEVVREQLITMLTWHIGVKTHFAISPGKRGKYFKQFLELELWAKLQKTYSDADYENTWDALFTTCDLFRLAAFGVSRHFGFDYPHGDDKRVSAHLAHVRSLPREATEIY